MFIWAVGFACLVASSEAGAPPDCTVCTSSGCPSSFELNSGTECPGNEQSCTGTFGIHADECVELDASASGSSTAPTVGKMAFKDATVTNMYVQYSSGPALYFDALAFKSGPVTVHMGADCSGTCSADIVCAITDGSNASPYVYTNAVSCPGCNTRQIDGPKAWSRVCSMVVLASSMMNLASST